MEECCCLINPTGDDNNKNKKERTPRGHMVVYVEEEMKRHVVPIGWLKNREFRQLLDAAADAYGFHGHAGRILLPCNDNTFRAAAAAAAAAACKPYP